MLMTKEEGQKIWQCVLEDGIETAVDWYGRENVEYVCEYIGLDNWEQYFS